MEITLSWNELLLVVVLATAAYLLESVLFSRRRPSSSIDPELEGEIHALRAELARLRHRLDQIDGKTGAVRPPEEAVLHSPYDFAVEYARQGMIAPEIASRCGISRDEAALIVAMQRRGQEAG